MSKKSARGAVLAPTSRVPSSSTTSTTSKSSILKSSFAPSKLQLALFASVIQGFESQVLRIHDTNTGRLRCEHAAGPGTRITSLDWGCYGISYRENSQLSAGKKRKRDQLPSKDAVLAFGTSQSTIQIFSPAEAKVVGKLGGVHEHGVRDFKFTRGNDAEAWSIGGDGKLVRWNLSTDQATMIISLPDPNVDYLASPYGVQPSVLCASSTPFSIEVINDDDFKIQSFDSFKNSVKTILRSGTGPKHESENFLAADSDRYINIYQLSDKRLSRTLIAGSEVENTDLYTPSSDSNDPQSQQLLAVVTKAGEVELFMRPFSRVQPAINGDLKKRRKAMTAKATAKIRLISSTAKMLEIFNASLQGPDLLVATTEGGINVGFQKFRWQDEGNGELLFDGIKDITYNQAASALNTVATNSAKDIGRFHVDESKTVVVNGVANNIQHETIEISSSEDEALGENEDDVDLQEQEKTEDVQEMESAAGAVPDANEDEGEDKDVEMHEAPGDSTTVHKEQLPQTKAEDVDEQDNEEPTFGELLVTKHGDPISISDAFQEQSTSVVAINNGNALDLPSGISLSTVLSQALRTNDQNLLESCLHTTDSDIIMLTIQRIDSSLAGVLLQKLSERLASRPGRFGPLLQWVQWTCIAHGGAIASNPEVVSRVKNLYKILTERSKSLDSLLLLKGKLDMLDAQQQFRKQLEKQRGTTKSPLDEPGIIYIEGQSENWESDEDEDALAGPSRLDKGKATKKSLEELVEDESEDDEDMPITNGISHSEDDDDNKEEDESGVEDQEQRGNGIVDDEAEEEDSHPSDNEAESSEENDEDSEEIDSEMADFIDDDDSVPDVELEAVNEKPAVKKARRT